MKQRKQLLNPLGLHSPHLSQHLLRLLLLLVTAIGGVGSSWAETETFSMSTKWNASSKTQNDITVSFDASAANFNAGNNGYVIVTKSGTGKMTISAVGKTITSFTISYNGGNAPSASGNSCSANTGSINAVGTEWTGSANSVEISYTAGSTGIRVASVVVTYTDGGAPQTYTVSYNLLGHGESIVAVPGVSAIPTHPTDPTATGYAFNGWYTDSRFGTQATVGSSITKDTQLCAKWTTTGVPVSTNQIFSMTVTGNVGNAASRTAVENPGNYVSVTGGSITAIYNGASEEKGMSSSASSNDINIGGSSGSYVAVTLDENLKAGDVISIPTGVFVLTTTDNKDNKVYTASDGKYIVEAGDILNGQNKIYIWKEGGWIITTVEVLREATSFTITYNTNGGTQSEPTEVTEQTAMPSTFPLPTKAGNVFGGWYTDSECTNLAVKDAAISANTTLYALWTEQNYSTDANNLVVIPTGTTISLIDVVPNTPIASADNTIKKGFDKKSSVFANNYLQYAGTDGYNNRGTKNYEDGSSYVPTLDIKNSGREIKFKLPADCKLTIYGSDPSSQQDRTWHLTNSSGVVATEKNAYCFTCDISQADTYTLTTTVSNSTLQLAAIKVEPATSLYTVTYNLNGGTGTVPTQEDVATGATFTVASADGITKDGFTFNGWNDGTRSYLAGDTYTMGAANVTLTAQWQQNAGNKTVNDLVTISEDFRFIPSVTFDKGKLYEDDKLFSAGGNTNSNNGLQFKSNRAIAFKVNSGAIIKVTAKSNNSTETRDIQLGTSTSNYTDLATLGVAPAATATLTYTYTGENNGLIYLTSNSELFLKELDVIYSPSYTVTYDLNGGTGTAPTQEALFEGDVFTVGSDDNITKTGYTFVAWNDGKDNYSEGDSYTMGAANVIFTAQWEANTYEVKYKDEGNANFSGDGGTAGFPTRHTYGTATVLPTPTKVGYAFAGWFTSNDCSGVAITQIGATDITSSITLYAKWVLDGETLECIGWLDQQSEKKALNSNQSLHITFNNKSKGSANYHNWILFAGTNANMNHDYMALRADEWDNNNDGNNSTRKMKQNGDDVDWDVFKADMAAGADVDIYVANSGNKLYVHATMTAGSNTYDYTAETKTSASTVYISMSGETCTLSGIKITDPVTAYSVNASTGEKCESVTITNTLGMPVSNGTCVPSGEKITFTATPEDASYVFEGWKTGDLVQDTKNPTTLDVIFDIFVEAVYGDAPTPAVEVTSVLVAGKEYKETLAGNIFTAGTYYGDPTIEVTLSDGTKPVVTKNNQNNISTTSAATFTSTDGVNYIINYKQKNVSTQDLTVLSEKTATTWNFKTSLTRPSYIIGNWTWNNMTITSSEEKYIELNSGGIISYTGNKTAHTFTFKVPGPGTLTINGHAARPRYFDVENANGEVVSTVTMNTTSNHDWTADYNGPATTLTFYLREDEVMRIEYIKWTPSQPITTIEIPSAVTVHVGELHRFTAGNDVIFKNGEDVVNASVLGNFTKTWTLIDGSSNVKLENKNRTEGKVTGLQSNTSDNLTARVKFAVAGVESNECTVTVVRTPLAVRADHIALSHNGNDARTLKAVTYNPYTREAVSSNIELSAAIKSGSSAFATSTGNTITPTGTETGTETWTVTATPKSGKPEASNYTSGSTDIEVTCRNYLYAYNTSVPATTPTARPVENAAGDVALNYYAGHNPVGCFGKDSKTNEYYVLKTWGDKNRGPQEQVLANYSKTKNSKNEDVIQRPFARIHGWDGIKNVAEPTMNSLSEQHSASTDKNDHANGKFSYKQYSYSGTHDEFNVPVMGSFYRFYPEKNGTLIAYLCVNGQFSDSDMEKLAIDNNTQTGYASRNTYFLDPYANSMDIQNATVQPTSTIQTGFFYYTLSNCKNTANLTRDIEALLNNWAAWGNDEKNENGELVIPVKNSSYAAGKTTYTISDVDWDLFKNLAQDKVGIFHQPIANGDGSFRVITKTYVRCEVPVEKGRVYYVSPTGTKTRMAGVEFIPENDPVAENVDYYNGTISAQTDTSPYVVQHGQNSWMVEGNNGKYYNVTLKDRKFKANQWYSFCMPFDVPQKQIHDIFGADAITIHFDNVKEETNAGVTTLKMNFWSHFYDQTRAGRPIMIKMPATFPDGGTELAAGSVTFQHVKLNMVDPASLYITDQESGWVFKGSYIPVTMEKNAVILNNQTFYHYLNTAKTLAGNRAWIQGPAVAPGAKFSLVTSISMFDEEDENTATGIEEVLAEMGLNVMNANSKIYDIKGQMVGNDINKLPKGIYIVNGKKMVVK